MNKLVKRIVLVVLALTAVYTAAAWFLLRGLGAYRLGTTVGMILSHSWQYTGLAALVLAVWAVASSLLRRKKGEKIAAASPEGAAAQPAPKEKKPHRGRKDKAVSDRLQPARPEGKLAPAAPAAGEGETAPMPENVYEPGTTMPMPEDVDGTGATALMPEDVDGADETLPMPEDMDEAGSTALMPEDVDGADETLPMPEDMDEAGATALMPEDVDGADETLPMPEDGEAGATALMPEAAGGAAEGQCPNCHAAVKPGAKFCVKCGTRLGG